MNVLINQLYNINDFVDTEKKCIKNITLFYINKKKKK